MISKLEVRLSLDPATERVVGRLALHARRTYFEYDPAFLETRLEISPFKLPAGPGLVEHRDLEFGPLPGVFEDSLPDGWGLILMNRALRKVGVDPVKVTPLDRLAWLGTSTMGALTYHPPREREPLDPAFDLSLLARNAEAVLEGDVTEVIPALIRAGGSPGGARPKVLVGRRGERLVSGEGTLPPGFDPWLVKFSAREDRRDAGPMEFAYALMARSAGIVMPEVEILDVDRSRRAFAVRRFDRGPGNSRIHFHTFANLLQANFRAPSTDYRDLMKVTHRLTANHQDLLRAFRQMAFNIASHNRDDHGKNFAFLMNDQGEWCLSPAFDLVFSGGPGGEHSMSVLGEGRDPGGTHCFELAKQCGIKSLEATRILEEIDEAVARWPGFADQAGLSRRTSDRIQSHHRRIGARGSKPG